MIRCRTKIHKNPGGAYIDVTDRLSTQPVITQVESYGISATFGVVNNVKNPLRNLLDERNARWSDGSTGAVETGMYVSFVHEVSRDQTIDGAKEETVIESKPLSYTMIMTMEANDGILSFTSGDAIQILRATGIDYYRDHYSREGMEIGKLARGGWTGSQLYIAKPAEAHLYGGAAGDAQWAIPEGPLFYTENNEGGSEVSMGFTSPGGPYGSYLRMEAEMDKDFITNISVRANCGLTSLHTLVFTMYDANLNVLYSTTFNNNYRSGWQTYTFNVGAIPVTKGQRCWFEIRSDQHMATSQTWRIAGGARSGSFTGALQTVQYDARTSTTTPLSGFYLAIGVNVLRYSNATGSEDATDATRWLISAIDDVDTLDESLNEPDFVGRARISFAGTANKISVRETFDAIVKAAGFDPSFLPYESSEMISVFRCSGAKYHEYLLALGDLKEESSDASVNGRQRVISAHPDSWSIVRMALRHGMSDDPMMAIYYAGDGPPNVGYPKMFMMSFSPKITKRNRPYLSMVRSTDGDDRPIMVALRDTDVSVGAEVTSIDTSSLDVTNAAFNAYANIMTNRSTDWEGEINLSGIHTQFLDSGDYADSGIPIRIFDSRYGMNDYASRVRGVKYDYVNLKTILTLNNYSIAYSNDLLNADRMAFAAGSVAIAATTDEQLNRQYIRMETDTDSAPILSANNVVRIRISENNGTLNDGQPIYADVVDITDLNCYFINAYFPTSTASGQTDPHGVIAVQVNNGAWIDIPEYRRPDKYYYQSLIVNVQIRKV